MKLVRTSSRRLNPATVLHVVEVSHDDFPRSLSDYDNSPDHGNVADSSDTTINNSIETWQ